jgi:hypothetical protein
MIWPWAPPRDRMPLPVALPAPVRVESFPAGTGFASALGSQPQASRCYAWRGQEAGVPRWSRTMAAASCWVSPEPAENA